MTPTSGEKIRFEVFRQIARKRSVVGVLSLGLLVRKADDLSAKRTEHAAVLPIDQMCLLTFWQSRRYTIGRYASGEHG